MKTAQHPGARPLSRLVLVALALFAPLTIQAQDGAPAADEAATGQYRFEIAAQPLPAAINAFIAVTGWQVGYPTEVARDVRANAVEGSFGAAEALGRMLEGTGVSYTLVDQGNARLMNVSAEGLSLAPVSVSANGAREYSSDATSTALGGDYGLAPKDTPVSGSAVGKELMKEQDAIELRDVARNMPGVQFSGTYFNNYDNFSIRGFELPRINGYLRNGRPAVHLHQSSFIPVERVEVLKGPASILYGNLSPGGVINLQTFQPLAEPHARVEGSLGLYNDYRALVDGGNRLGDSGGAWRLVAGVRDSESFRDQVTSEEQTLYGTARLPVGEQSSLLASFEITEQESTVDNGVVGSNPNDPLDTAMDLPRSRFLGEPEGRGKYDNDHLHLQFDTLLGGWDTSILYTYAWNERDVRQVVPNDFGWPSPFVNNDGRTVRRYTNAFIGKRLWHNGLIDFSNVFQTGNVAHHVGVGASYRLEKTSGTGNSFVGDFNPAPPNNQEVPPIDLFEPDYSGDAPFRYSAPFDTQYKHYSGLYLQDAMHIGQDWVALLGLRYDEDVDREEDEKTTAFSPRAGLLYRVTDHLSVYGSYAESFEPIAGVDRDNDRWDPSKGEQFELGAKRSLFNDRALLTLAVYELSKVDTLVEDPDNPMFQIQDGERRSRGAELEIAGSVTDRLDLRAGYTYTDTEIVEADANEGNRFGEIPLHRANIWAGYDLKDDLRLGGGVFYTGDQYSGDDNELELDSYTVVDVFAQYDVSGDTRVRMNVKNLFDNKYFTQAGGSVYPGSNGLQFGEPLTWQVHIEHAF